MNTITEVKATASETQKRCRAGLRVALRLGLVGVACLLMTVAIESDVLVSVLASSALAIAIVMAATCILYLSGEVRRETTFEDLLTGPPRPFMWCFLLGMASLAFSQSHYDAWQYYNFAAGLLWFAVYAASVAMFSDGYSLTWHSGVIAVYTATVCAGLGAHIVLGASDWAWQVLWWQGLATSLVAVYLGIRISVGSWRAV